MKNPRKRKDVALEKVLNITENMSPDDLEIGKLGDLQNLVEKKDDLNPDDLGQFIRDQKGNPNGR